MTTLFTIAIFAGKVIVLAWGVCLGYLVGRLMFKIFGGSK